MSNSDKSNPWLATVLGGILVGIVLLYLEYKTDFFNDSSEPTNTIQEGLETAAPTGTLPFSFPFQSMGTLEADYAISKEQIVGKYIYRIWKKKDDFASFVGDNVGQYVTLSLSSEPMINIEEFWGFPVRVDLLTGRDITGEGNPDLIVETYSGGAHCCSQFFVFDLGEFSFSKYLETKPSNCPGEFQDLNYDGAYEFITCDDVFAYSYCSFASSPTAPVIMKFVDGAGYRPATPEFRGEIDIGNRIIADVVRAEQGQNQDTAYWDKNENLLCPAIQVALDYLYIGDIQKAEQEFRRMYGFPDVDQIWLEVYQTASSSPLYTP